MALDNAAQGKAKRRPGLNQSELFWRRENMVKKALCLTSPQM
jgi:hypothetical protein